ncbi:hypothetical protein JCM3775_003548 [Rhodotorula graminis]
MGNNPSTPQAPPGSTRSSRNSPRSRTVSLPSPADSPAHAQQQHRPHSSRRRKPSIELPDVQPSPQLPRRKGSDRPPVVDEELDPDPPEGQGGSLRGALQGKADHVVYGPRRQDDETTLLKTPPALVPTPTAAAAAAAAPPPPKPAAAMAIPGTGTPRPSPRTPGGGGPGARDGSLTNAGMGAIGASPLMDPDDTTHPGFGASARLTSAVLMSTENMPVVGSPPSREDVPGALAQRSRALGAGGSTTMTDSGGSTASGPGGGAGYDTPDAARSGTDVRRVVPSPQTSFGGAASSILAPSPSSTTAASYSSSAATATPASALPSHLPLPSHDELPMPHTASPSAPSAQPSDTVLAPVVPTDALPLASEAIPSGTSVIASPPGSGGPTTPTGGAFAPTDASGAGADGVEGAGPTYVAHDGSRVPSPAVLLPPAVFNAPVAALPIPLLSVPSQTIAQSLMAAAVDLGAGEGGVPTLIKWRDEDGQEAADVSKGKAAKGPRGVFVTGTFAKGWKTKIELRKTDPSDFSALIMLPPGPHRLKFIVDDEWKASKHLPVATDADGNLINYLQVNPRNSKIPVNVWAPPPPPQQQPASGPASSSTIKTSTATSAAATGVPVPTAVPTSAPVATSAVVASSTTTPATTPLGAPTSRAYVAGGSGYHNGVYWPVGPDEEGDGAGGGASLAAAGVHDPADDDHHWSQEIPAELVAWGEWEQQRDEIESAYYAAHPNGPDDGSTPPDFPPPPASAGVQPPTLPAQLEKGPLNHAAYVTQGSGDDNSILPKPDHSVINHLAASPIKGGFLSVGVTTRYKRKFVTIVYYKALNR